ncbi:penicillin-binding protein [Tuberibacillus sp. Marseille-P3662]|uniref:penicillin-binding protein n=1 Tax=Tuberibacillus sp. Marseille-P3662 TaxID=1965358 RepID=UPI000A1CB0F3|nr:penicillin-binding protein [Tuberibacillus sp. Marseille-P3662]
MFPSKNKSINRWALVLALGFLLLFSIILGRFCYIVSAKEINDHNIIQFGENQWTQMKTKDADRGTIYDRNHRILAHDVPAYTVYAVLSEDMDDYVKDEDVEKTAKKLAPILDVEADKLASLMHKDRFQVEFGTAGKKLSYDKMKKIKALDLPGIHFKETSKRFYPNKSFSPYVIGFTKYDQTSDQQKGLMGLEQSLNQQLKAHDGQVTFEKTQDGVILADTKQTDVKANNGANAQLTLDYKIQTVLEESMSKVNQEYNPERMIGIVANPKTGEILAMSNRPTFNPNKRNVENYYNMAISTPYEPGSVMKTFTLAAAMNEGVWNGQATFDSGSYRISDNAPSIHDWRGNWGKINYRQGFIRSSNVAFSRVVDKQLGSKTFHEYLQKFGFTEKTGIDLPHEANSQINFKYPIDQVMTGFGQASAFTPIQIVQAATAIANDGQMMQPYVIDKVVDPDNQETLINHEPKSAGHPVSKQTAQNVRGLMRQVVANEDHGTGNDYQIEGYDIIGKTGTAQIPDKNGYMTGKNNYIFSFLGMAPKKDPELVVYIAVDRPEKGESESVSKVFRPVMKNSLQYMNIKPSKKDDQAKTVQVQDLQGKDINNAAKVLEKKGLNPVVIGTGKVTDQIPYSGSELLQGSKVILAGERDYHLPDLRGWSLSDSLKVADVLEMQLNLVGHGFVKQQQPKPDKAIKKGDDLVLNLETRDKKQAPESKDKKEE